MRVSYHSQKTLYSWAFFQYADEVIIPDTMFLHTYSPQPILAHLGSFTVHWYGLFLSLGALAGFIAFRWLGKRHGLKTADVESLFFWMIVAGLVGARLYHVVNEWQYYATHPTEILSIWNGGLAIHGGLLAGLGVLVLFARRKHISAWLLADLAVPAVAIGQAIGRWGNYFNQELFGRPTDLPWGIPIEPLNRPIEYLQYSHFHPTFLYESLGSLAVFVVLMMMHRRLPVGPVAKNAGLIALTYFMAESVIRSVTEWLRIDRVPLVADVRLPLLVSLAIAATAAFILFRRLKKMS